MIKNEELSLLELDTLSYHIEESLYETMGIGKVMGWSKAFFGQWIRSRVEDGRCYYLSSAESVYCLGLFRFLNHEDESSDEMFHDENGSILWVDLWYDSTRTHGNKVLEFVKSRCNGKQTKFAYARGLKENDDKVRIFDINLMQRFASQNGVK